MALPGLLIEYLIDGACGLVWIAIVAIRMGILSQMPQKEWALFLLPILYVLGMMVDFVALLLGKPIEYVARSISRTSIVRKRGRQRHEDSKGQEYKRILDGNSGTAFIMLRSERLGQEYVMRSSRDRIARGAVANCIITTIVIGLSVGHMPHQPSTRFLNSVPSVAVWFFGTLLSVLFAGMWLRFQRLTSRWKREAVLAIVAQQNGGTVPSDTTTKAAGASTA